MNISILIAGDEVLEWNGHSLVGKTFDEVHDVISESRHDPQVELRVARSLSGHAVQVQGYDSLGRPLDRHRYANSQACPRGRAGPSVTLSDPLGGTTHMLNPPPHHHSNHPGSTRIQVSPDHAD